MTHNIDETQKKVFRIRQRFSQISIRKAFLITLLACIPAGLLLIILGASDTLTDLRIEIFAILLSSLIPLALIIYAFRKKNLKLYPILSYSGRYKRELLMVVPLMMFSFGVIWVTILLFYLISPNLALGYLDFLNSIDFLITSADTPLADYLFIFISIAIFVPILEELIFRGAMIERLGTKYNYKAAVITSSIIFGFLHADIMGAFAVGLILSLIYLKTSSLLIPVIIHAINNGLFVILIYLDDQLFQIKSWDSLEPYLQYGWIGAVLFLISSAWLLHYLKQNWHLVFDKSPISKSESD